MRKEPRLPGKPVMLRLAMLCLSVLILQQTGCYHYRVAGERVPPATQPRREILWSTVWGLSQQNIYTDSKCLGNPISEVTTSTNFGYVLLTVISFGFVAPIEVEWTCAKDRADGDDF